MASAPGPSTLSEEERRILAPWTADCALRTLAVFESKAPADRRPREAIEGLRAFARGELKIGPVRALAARAHAAARDVGDPAATAAARAAGHAAATAHMASHARGVPAYGALAVKLSDPSDLSRAAGEFEWALHHASPAARDVLRRLPAPGRGGGELGRLIRELDAFVRSD